MHKLNAFLQRVAGPHNAPAGPTYNAGQPHSIPPYTAQPEAVQSYTGQPHSIQPHDVYRYRKQRGINLGSWFTLERWISEEPYRKAHHPAQSDYDVANGSGAQEILEQHWDTWITDADWAWLSEHGFNTVRIPIGFYHACGLDPCVLHGTDFAHLGAVYSGAWWRIVRAIDTAARFGIGVMIDLHAAPGKQNRDAHSGQTGPVRFYERGNMDHTLRVLVILADALQHHPNIVGLQLLNEPQNDNRLAKWYTATIDAIRRVAPTLPLYIHDAWDANYYASFVGSRPPTDFVAVDHHLYRCFTSADHKLSGDGHAAAMRNHMAGELARLAGAARGSLIIGEFSAALNPASYRSGEAGEQDRQRRVFLRAQLEIYEQHCAGWFFWTYKKDRWDAGWSARDAMLAEIVPKWFGIRRKPGQLIINDPVRRDTEKARALGQHEEYWSQRPAYFEHWRFAEGFVTGWEDAYGFLSCDVGSSISELGFRGQWTKRRLDEYIRWRGASNNNWEYEHGFAQGVDAAKNVFQQFY